jgi:hypothetical protein
MARGFKWFKKYNTPKLNSSYTQVKQLSTIGKRPAGILSI